VDRPRPPLGLIEGGAGAPRRADVAAAAELAALGLGLTLVCALWALLPSWFRELGRFQALYAAGFGFYALAVLRLPRYATLPHVGMAVLAVAVCTRAVLVPVSPSLSGDVFRYVWEGRVLVAGGNPYAQSPLDPALAPLRDAAVWPEINHKHLATIYPPLAEAGYALVAALSPTVTALKAWVALHDVALVAVLLALARRSTGSAATALVYAWNPLVLVHYAGSGHNDPTAMVWLALAFLLAPRRPVASAACLAAAVMVKLVPVAALPFLARGWPWRARILAAALVTGGLAWFWALTRATYSGLAAYWGSWRNNESVFAVLDAALGGYPAARAASLVLVAGVALWAWVRLRSDADGARLTLGAVLLTSPVLHPWYLGWVLMFTALRVSWPWLILSLTVILNYGVLGTPAAGRSFHLPAAWRVLEYGVPLAVALLLAARARRGRPPPREGPHAP
jgi:hypothetical protein